MIIVIIMLVCGILRAQAKALAGTTADRATRVTENTMLSIQSGSNYIRIEALNLPATVTYLPDTAFGPLPTALVTGDTLPAVVTFRYDDCRMGWKWTLEKADDPIIMEIKAHENASLYVEPRICPTLGTATVEVYDSYLSPQGNIYTESGNYEDTIMNVAGCDSIITIHLTVYETSYDTLSISGCDEIEYGGQTYTQGGFYNDTVILASGDRIIKTLELTIGHTIYSEETVFKKDAYTSPRGNTYTESGDYTEKATDPVGCDSIITIHLTIGDATCDTVYFCRGYNREHEEQVNELLIRRYLPYTYESPALTDYKEGVVKEVNADGVLVDLNRAEANLYAHYTGGLTPIETIAWSVRQAGESAYTPIVVESAPQWVALGSVAVQIRFLCGEIYTDALPIRYEGLEDAQTEQQPIKRIENGNVVIIRGGVRYTLMGERIK